MDVDGGKCTDLDVGVYSSSRERNESGKSVERLISVASQGKIHPFDKYRGIHHFIVLLFFFLKHF